MTKNTASGLAQQSTSLERVARDKYSSLLRKFITYGCKKFYNIGIRRRVVCLSHSVPSLIFICKARSLPLDVSLRSGRLLSCLKL
jgi:hypothetical protein